MKKITKILRIIPTLDPKFGGPANAIIDSSNLLVKKGIKVDILTNDKKFNVNLKKDINIFNIGRGIGSYNFSLKFYKWIKQNRDKYNMFIIHGIWNFSTLVARILLKRKYYVFLHGALDPYFKLEVIKYIKKKIYWNLIEKQNLIFSKGVLLKNKFEKKQLGHTYVKTDGINKINVGYGILEKKQSKKKLEKIFYKKFKNLKGKRFYLFLGRFHKKKGCLILIKSVEQILKKNKDIFIFMAGPDSEYKKKMQKYCITNNLNKNIFWSDEISGNIKWGAIHCSYCMLLPSHGENFGISLVESLSYSRPVITTKKVGIHSYIKKYNAGMVTMDSLNDFYKKLKLMNSIKKQSYNKLCNNAYRCFKDNYDLNSTIKNLYNIIKKN